MQKKLSEQRSRLTTISARLDDLVRRASADCSDDDGNVYPGPHFELVERTPPAFRYRWYHSRVTTGGRQLRLGYNSFANNSLEFVHIECVYHLDAYDVKHAVPPDHPRVFTCTCSNEVPWTSVESILWDAVGWLDSDGVRFGK